MADGTLKVGTITTSSGSGTITIPNTVTVAGAMANTPAFFAFLSSDSSVVSDATWTKVQIDSELFDTDNCYDNSSNYRFTPTTAGKYKVEYGITFNQISSKIDGGKIWYQKKVKIDFLDNQKTYHNRHKKAFYYCNERIN